MEAMVNINGSTIHLDDSNENGIEDGKQEHPCDTIQEGLGVALSEYTVRVAAGTNYENKTLKDRMKLLGAGAEVTGIDGGGRGSIGTAQG